MLQVGLLEITAHGSFVRLLVHQIAVNLHSKVCVVCFRAFELEFRVKRLPQHGAALHFIRPDRGTVHAWCCRPQFRQSIGYAPHKEQCDGAINDPSDLLGPSVRWSLDIHILSPSRTQLSGPRFPSLSIFFFNGLAGILLSKTPRIARKWDSPSQLRTSAAHSLSPFTLLDCVGPDLTPA